MHVIKKYEIVLENGQTFHVDGKMLTYCEKSGQSLIYSEWNALPQFITAIVPKNALIKVLYENS